MSEQNEKKQSSILVESMAPSDIPGDAQARMSAWRDFQSVFAKLLKSISSDQPQKNLSQPGDNKNNSYG